LLHFWWRALRLLLSLESAPSYHTGPARRPERRIDVSSSPTGSLLESARSPSAPTALPAAELKAIGLKDIAPEDIAPEDITPEEILATSSTPSTLCPPELHSGTLASWLRLWLGSSCASVPVSNRQTKTTWVTSTSQVVELVSTPNPKLCSPPRCASNRAYVDPSMNFPRVRRERGTTGSPRARRYCSGISRHCFIESDGQTASKHAVTAVAPRRRAQTGPAQAISLCCCSPLLQFAVLCCARPAPLSFIQLYLSSSSIAH